jgi:hypothetical protein
MQEDYEIIVIVSLLFITDFLLKFLTDMQEIAFLSLRKSNIFWGSMPRRLGLVNLKS